MKDYVPHLGDVAVLEACAQPGCPICRLKNESERKYLVLVLHDYVDAPDLREEFCQAWGYCHAHAWGLSTLERGNLLTVAIMYQDVLERETKPVLERQNAAALTGGGLRRLFGKKEQDAPAGFIPPHTPCPACRLGELVETNAINILLSGLAKQEARMRQTLRASDGLCLAHLQKALLLGKDAAVREYLLSQAKAQLAEILAELKEFARKHDYRFQHEEIGEERRCWQRAITLITGSQNQ
ncbi:hypothetical protein U14_05355 [Candidatus Moduliflexus flocculans]|uniref:Uncharacterized protein n=1 Tax=Candidatus Moduliflexus flocculans TaxID=1499966 RepID=A0A081BRP7_9BACT|nr:hypothetical protein U14_05355 [Candidatus Moduliflexus flocculans]